jgi:cobalt/nickel transport system permease protein
LHHLVLERWSRGSSILHSRDPRAKLTGLLLFLVALGTTPIRRGHLPLLAYALLLALGIAIARLPMGAVLWRSSLVLPFTAAFSLMSWISGDAARAVSILEKSYLSATAVLLVAATTPVPEFIRGLEGFGAPKLLLLVVQFLYRYLFVIAAEARDMRAAALSRGGRQKGVSGFRAAAGMLTVLFARSYARAEAIHHAMVARGFDGTMRLRRNPRLRFSDAVFVAVCASIVLGIRLGIPPP